MHPIDDAIYTGKLTLTLLNHHAALPAPDAGTSYWGDHVRAGRDPLQAARLAHMDMLGTAMSVRSALR